MNETTLEERVLKVPSQNQITENIVLDGQPDGWPRVMFLGNSITLHASKADIGWYGNWGMAASCREKDYVHQVMAALRKQYPNAAFCVAQGSIWETTLERCDYQENFAQAKAFGADVIVSTLEANIPVDIFDGAVFCREIGRLHRYLAREDGTTRLVMASSMCRIPEKDTAIQTYAASVNAKYVHVGDIFADPANLAIGLFEHEGIQNHPSDVGMSRLAERYLEAILEYLPKTEGERR